jgi:hypothetical protein
MLTAKDNSKIKHFPGKFLVTLINQGDIHNPEIITRRYHYHRSICAFVFYSLTGKRPVKIPVPKCYSLPCLLLDNATITKVKKKKHISKTNLHPPLVDMLTRKLSIFVDLDLAVKEHLLIPMSRPTDATCDRFLFFI